MLGLALHLLAFCMGGKQLGIGKRGQSDDPRTSVDCNRHSDWSPVKRAKFSLSRLDTPPKHHGATQIEPALFERRRWLPHGEPVASRKSLSSSLFDE
jgi:hypothetical protein